MQTPRPRSLAALLALGAAPLAAQDCGPCKGTGQLDCKRCDRALEAQATYCSVAAGCTACRGVGAVACASCKGAESSLAARRDGIAEWAAQRQARLTAAKLSAPPVLVAVRGAELWFAPRTLSDCPEADAHRQAHLYAARVAALLQRTAQLLGVTAEELVATERPLTLGIFARGSDVERLSALFGIAEPQGAGVLDATARVALLQVIDPRDAPLHRATLQAAAQLALAPHLGTDPQQHRAWAWLRVGLAHWLSSDLGGGVCESIVILDHPQPAARYFGGDWRLAVSKLRETRALPKLDDLLGRDVDGYDLAAHATVFAVVDWLVQGARAAPTTGASTPAVPLIAQVWTAARAGEAPAAALRRLLRSSDEHLAPAFEAWVATTYTRR